jgi:hypothetical protein
MILPQSLFPRIQELAFDHPSLKTGMMRMAGLIWVIHMHDLTEAFVSAPPIVRRGDLCGAGSGPVHGGCLFFLTSSSTICLASGPFGAEHSLVLGRHGFHPPLVEVLELLILYPAPAGGNLPLMMSPPMTALPPLPHLLHPSIRFLSRFPCPETVADAIFDPMYMVHGSVSYLYRPDQCLLVEYLVGFPVAQRPLLILGPRR